MRGNGKSPESIGLDPFIHPESRCFGKFKTFLFYLPYLVFVFCSWMSFEKERHEKPSFDRHGKTDE